MSAALGFLALALLGAEGAPRPAAPQIVYEFRLLELTGVDWRQGVYASLQPVARQGSATIWTTTDAVAATIAKTADHVVMAPKVTAVSEAPAHVSTKVARGVVTQLSRQGNGLCGHAMLVAYTPEMEKIRDGFATTVTGRKLDQGVLVRLVLDDTRVAAVHPVYFTGVERPDGNGDAKPQGSPVPAKLEVPEVLRSELAGEWLIPNGGVLLASLGPHYEADATGKAVVRERLVLVKAEAASPLTVNIVPGERRILVEPIKPRMAAPSAPSRTLPQGVNADGEPVPLPPLPPEPPAPTARPDSAEPVATPQTKHAPELKPTDADDEAKDEAARPAHHEETNDCAAPNGTALNPPACLLPFPLIAQERMPQPFKARTDVKGTTPVPAPEPVPESTIPAERTATAAPPAPVHAYQFRWPLNGADLELRIVLRGGAEPTSRASWRPAEEAKK